MVSGMDAMLSCILNLCDVRMRIAITCMQVWCLGATPGILLKKKSVSGGSFIRGNSVEEELNHIFLNNLLS